MSTSIRDYEVAELGWKFLPSQKRFIFSPQRYKFFAGGFRAGKTRAMCTAGLILSAVIPGNRGAVFCYRGTDVEARVKPIFDEIIPESWLKRYSKANRTWVLRNNSVIMLRHLHDTGAGTNSAAKTRRIGMNLGWLGVDQLEECQAEHWNAIISRLSYAGAPKKFAFATLNPNGHDWIYEKAFKGMLPWPKDTRGNALPLDGRFYQEFTPEKDVLGIVSNSEENRTSNGGFIEDEYFDSLLNQYDDAWINRYVHSNFDEFKGKLLTGYEAGLTDDRLASVHNVEPFPIPLNWQCVVGIDVGGDSPWAIVPTYVDEYGNLIVVPGYHERTGIVDRPAQWIKSYLPHNQNRCTYIIDPENKLASAHLLQDHGIATQTAIKDVLPGLLQMNAYFHVVPGRELPSWYMSTQPQHKIAKFGGKGSPRIFVFNTATYIRREWDTAKWHPDKPNEVYMTSTQRFDAFHATRYVTSSRPPVSIERVPDRYAEMWKRDPLSAREHEAFDERIRRYQAARKGGLGEMDTDIMGEPMTRVGRNDLAGVREEW